MFSLFDDGDPRRIEAMEELHKTPGWPFDAATDDVLVRDLLEQFPTLDLAEEIRKFRAWMLDLETTKKVRHRARLRNWCKIAVGRPVGPRSAAGARRGGAAVATADDHGATSDRLDEW